MTVWVDSCINSGGDESVTYIVSVRAYLIAGDHFIKSDLDENNFERFPDLLGDIL